MDMLDVHAKASESSIVAYNDFLLYYKSGIRKVYGFVEGKEDPSYYRGFIDAVLPEGWECKLFRLGNKKKVLEVFAAMDWTRFPSKRIGFFVDRDLSCFLGGEKCCGDNLYISDNYSIENDLVCVRIFERILEEVYGVSGLHPAEIDKIRSIFERNLLFFAESLAPVMAYIIILRRNEMKGDNLIARLDKIKPHDFFEYTNGILGLRTVFSAATQRIIHVSVAVGAPQPDVGELEKTENEFRAANGVAKYTRGKYLIRFLIDCVESVRGAIPVLFPRFGTAPGSNGGLGAKVAMMIIGPRGRCPATLKNFLELNFISYIRDATKTH